MGILRYQFRRLLLLLALAPFVGVPAAAADEQGPHLIITYQTSPKDRPELWEYAASQWLDRLDAWRQDDVFTEYRLLLNSYVDDYTWDAMLIVRFGDYAQIRHWNEIEKNNPGGLDSAGLQFVTPDHSYLANRPFSRRSTAADPAQPVYFVIPYEYRSEAEYERYAQTYVLPQFDGWVDAEILNGYEVLLNRHPTGKPWDVLLVLEYRDIASFGQRDDVKWELRGGLAERPDWKLVSDIKQEFRTELETVIAEPVRR